MKKALRISYNAYFDDKVFERNIKLVRENADVIDEITLFTNPTHQGYWTLERERETVDVLKDRIKKYKEAGINRVGLNVLSTLGHNEDGTMIAPKADLQYIMNIDGVTSGACLCPSDDRFTPYVYEKYSYFASCGADFIWLDDDIRARGHGVAKDYCFCPECVKKFNLKFGTDYTIEQIRELYKRDWNFKLKWKQSAHDTFNRLFKTLRDAIKNTNPSVDIGYMSGLEATVPEWIESSGSTLGRPGGGFYNDLTPVQMFEKAFMMQQCIERYPKEITDIQYEYEEYNFLTLQKSRYIAELESSLMILAGCNGMLYNRLEHTADFVDMMRKSAKKWDVLCDSNEGCKPIGVFCVNCHQARCLNEIGIPTTAYMDKAYAFYILSGDWNRFSNDEIEKMLKIGVYTDAVGLTLLKKKGFCDLGGEVGICYPNGVWEHFTDHKLNGDVVSRERWVSLDIFKEADAFELIPDESAETLSMLNSAFGGLRGASMYVYRRDDGSVIAVDGCLMPKQLQTDNKKVQMTNVFDLITGEKMPVVIEKIVKVIPTVTANERNVNIMLTNAHFDPTGEFEVKIRKGKDFKLLSGDGELIPISQRRKGEETVITVENMGAWQYLLLIGNV